MKRLTVMIVLLFVLASVGCATYYKVTDPHTGNVYYTDDLDRQGGGVVFKDANTHEAVSLQSSEVLNISKDEFKGNTGKK